MLTQVGHDRISYSGDPFEDLNDYEQDQGYYREEYTAVIV